MADLTITAQMNELLTTYNEEVREAVDTSAKNAAELCMNQLKSTSPKRPKHGEYARSWAVKVEEGSNGVAQYTVHNKRHYQLTHLLENGHVIRNKKGTYGRTRPIKHIAPAADAGIQRFDLEARTSIGRIK